MEALIELCKENADFASRLAVEFIGNINSAFRDFVKGSGTLRNLTTFVDYLPHAQLLQRYGSTDLQLLILAHTAIAPGNLPGKFFEYLASGNSILAIGPVEGDAGEVLRQTGAGEILERTDKAGIKKALMRYFSAWAQNNGLKKPDIELFTRRNLTGQLAALLESGRVGERAGRQQRIE
jgi:hypothetical protein